MLAGEPEREANVFHRALHGKVRLVEFPLEERLGEDEVKVHPPAHRAVTNRLGQDIGRGARLDAQGVAFRSQGLNAVAHAVMRELAHGARADRAGVGGAVSHGVEQGLAALIYFLLAPHHDGEAARVRADGGAAHGSVEHVRTCFRKLFMDAAHDGRVSRAQVDIDFPRADACENPVRPRGDALDLCGSRQGGEDNLTRAGHLFGRIRPLRASFDVSRRGFGGDVVDDELVARFLEVGRHARPHVSQSDESDFHHQFLFGLRISHSRVCFV